MRIPIHTARIGEERLLLEFQGTFGVEGGDPLGGHPLGTLECNGEDPPKLRVGHHELLGKVVELKNPVAIMVKEQEGGDGDAGAAGGPAVGYEIEAVIRKKILFMIRPKAIVDEASVGLASLKKAP